jgi:uncharacterized repeat protein (TIGR02543 family)
MDAVPQAQANSELRPFPQVGFPLGVPRIMPSGINQGQMNTDVVTQFAKIIPDFIVDPATSGTGNKNDFRMVLRHFGGTGATAGAVTTSESHGYGMMMLAYMAGAEDMIVSGTVHGLHNRPLREHLRANVSLPANLRNQFGANEMTVRHYFDAMYRCLRFFPSYNINDGSGTIAWTGGGRRTFLMAWELTSAGRPAASDNASIPLTGSFARGPFPSTATDGDLDMAYALLVAEKQWGGGEGGQNYGTWARGMINDIWLVNVDRGQHGGPAHYHLYLGNWVGTGTNDHGYVTSLLTRPSDFMLQHFRAFEEIERGNSSFLVNGQNRWTHVINRIVTGANSLQAANNSSGVLPDFVLVNRSTGAWTRPGGTGASIIVHERTSDGDHSANSCRVPWRMATDLLIHGGNPSVKTFHDIGLQRMNTTYSSRNFNLNDTNVGPVTFFGGHSNWGSVIYASPAMLATAVYGNVNRMAQAWSYVRNRDRVGTGNDRWYGAYFNVLAMITASGNWWCPAFNVTIPDMTGTVSISGASRFGETLSVNLSQVTPAASGLTLEYQWLRNGSNITANATGSTYTPVQADIGQNISVRVTAIIGARGELTSSAVNIEKALRTQVPNAPTLSAATNTMIAVAANPVITGVGFQFRIFRDGEWSAWQSNGTFSSLTAGTSYQFQARYIETTTHLPSNISTAASHSTTGISLPNPVTNWPNNLSATFGQTLGNITLPGNGTASVAGTWSWVDGTGTSVGNAGTRPHNLRFTPNNTTTHATVTQSVNVTVARANPTVNWPTGLSAFVGQTLGNVTIPNNTGTPGSFSWNSPGTSVGTVGSRSFAATFNPTDSANFNTAGGNVGITVSDAPQSFNVTVTSTGASGSSGSGTHNVNSTVNFNAGTRAGFTFGGWTAVGVTLANPNNATGSFSMPGNAVTLTANWIPSGSGNVTYTFTIPANTATNAFGTEGTGSFVIGGSSWEMGPTWAQYQVQSVVINRTSGGAYTAVLPPPVMNGSTHATWPLNGVWWEGSIITSPFTPAHLTNATTVVVTTSLSVIPESPLQLLINGQGNGYWMENPITPVVSGGASASFAVNVNGTYSATSGGGVYTSGQTVNVSAGTRPNFSFGGWTINSGGPLTGFNLSSASNTFTMPGRNVTITASWTPQSIVLGDVDGDGKIDAADITLLRRYIAANNKTQFIADNPRFRIENARVTGQTSGDPTSADVARLRQYIAGFPVILGQ